ncbi:hypothetical protein D9758_010253 [Tetrapyrgos nigripes]|nr:hypothetical protein D9758_010253 [Tetrapyrgos nigripes]
MSSTASILNVLKILPQFSQDPQSSTSSRPSIHNVNVIKALNPLKPLFNTVNPIQVSRQAWAGDMMTRGEEDIRGEGGILQIAQRAEWQKVYVLFVFTVSEIYSAPFTTTKYDSLSTD